MTTHLEHAANQAATDLHQHIAAKIGKTTQADLDLARTLRALRRDSGPAPAHDGYPAGGDGNEVRSTAELTSVEAAAEQLIYGRPVSDPHHDLTEQALSYLLDAARSLSAWRHTLNAIDDLTDQRPAIGRSEAVCCEPICEDVAEPGRRGRCSACALWRSRFLSESPNALCPPVPEQIIAERVANREKRRVHITGPLAVQ